MIWRGCVEEEGGKVLTSQSQLRKDKNNENATRLSSRLVLVTHRMGLPIPGSPVPPSQIRLLSENEMGPHPSGEGRGTVWLGHLYMLVPCINTSIIPTILHQCIWAEPHHPKNLVGWGICRGAGIG